MTWSRREFVQAGAVVAAGAFLPGGRLTQLRGGRLELDDDQVRSLAARALEAATAAGARHAEVRISHHRIWDLSEYVSGAGGITGTVSPAVYGDRADSYAIGVRALVGGAWGFSSSTIWTPDEAARLGTAAVFEARTTARAGMPAVELAPAPVVKDGAWAAPVARDPFAVSREEILDTVMGTAYYHLREWGTPVLRVVLTRMQTAFANTDGSFVAQTRYSSEGRIAVASRPAFQNHDVIGAVDPFHAYACPVAGLGWEYISRAPWYEIMARLQAEQEEDLALPLKPVEVGRYDVVFDQRSAARLLSGTIGAATELDRALGYEANAGGTSYLTDPIHMLGREAIGGPGLTVSANRSLPGGLATVRWDEEGVVPDDFPLVTDGVLTDLQTTRESAVWLAERYREAGRPMRSHGCAGGTSALDATQLQRPNLRLAPGKERADVAALLRTMGNGILIEGADVDMDFNALNGMTVMDETLPVTRYYEVKKGRKVARLKSTAVLFRAPELWKSVVALGGAESVLPIGVSMQKGEPAQETWHTVEAPPLLVRQMAIIDPTR
jgi:TldD protein